MTILQANKFHFVKGGADRYYLEVSRLLAEAGHRVEHLAMRHPENEPVDGNATFVEEVDYHASHSPWQALRAASRVVYNRESARRVRGLVLEKRPRVAHLHNIYHQLSLSVVRELDRHNIPMVMTLHDYKPVCPGYLLMTNGSLCERCRGGNFYHAAVHKCILGSRPASLVGSLEAYLHHLWGSYGKIALYLCPSQFLLEKVRDMGLGKAGFRQINYPLLLDRYEPDYEGSPVLIYAGRLSREKGIPTLLEAARREGVGSGWTLRVLGEGPLRGELEAKVRSWGLEDGIRFEGYLSGSDLHDAIRSARAVVVPSEWFENQPYAVLEAFALGKPVIGSRMGGIPEMVRDDSTGWTFPPGDAESLGECIRKALKEPGRASEMGREARRQVEERHNPGKHVEDLLAIYEEVAA
jgi:glycosyltransferase involved in cell wall biosynthesis